MEAASKKKCLIIDCEQLKTGKHNEKEWNIYDVMENMSKNNDTENNINRK